MFQKLTAGSATWMISKKLLLEFASLPDQPQPPIEIGIEISPDQVQKFEIKIAAVSSNPKPTSVSNQFCNGS